RVVWGSEAGRPVRGVGQVSVVGEVSFAIPCLQLDELARRPPIRRGAGAAGFLAVGAGAESADGGGLARGWTGRSRSPPIARPGGRGRPGRRPPAGIPLLVPPGGPVPGRGAPRSG